MNTTERTSLRELALLFFRLGTTSFGGPAAHVAMMRNEVVDRRGWLDERRFLDLVSATNLIPGPNSTELAIHLGYERRGWAGLVVSGLAFLTPAVALTALLAWVYVEHGAFPEVTWILFGIKPVILAIVVHALWKFAPSALPNWPMRWLALAALMACFLGAHELAVLLGAGVIAASRTTFGSTTALFGFLREGGAAAAVTAGSSLASSVTLPSLFFVFLKTGSLLFGSGYVLLAFLRADLVERLGWITEAQLVDSIAAGQVTPGPVFSSATFLGWVLAGPEGALLATLGIFLPAFVFVALSLPLLPRLRASKRASAFLDGLNVASFTLMAWVTMQLGRGTLVDPLTVGLMLASLALIFTTRLNSTWLVLGGACVSYLVHTLR